MRADVMRGLGSARKSLPSKYFYDARGAALFERITELDVYYPTRAECEILERHAVDIAAALGPACRVVEYGSGSGQKPRLLLRALDSPAVYVPVDISCRQLYAAAADLAREFAGLDVAPVCADYTGELRLPVAPAARRTVVFFPGSTIGNFEPAAAAAFLTRARAHAGVRGALVIGVDRRKDRQTLELAYNDPDGVTAAFNINLLDRLNRELGADFDTDQFEHRAVYDDHAGRIEMRLVSRSDQTVRVPSSDDQPLIVRFRQGEYIVTEHSYKYDQAEFSALAESAGWLCDAVFTDERRLFNVFLMQAQ